MKLSEDERRGELYQIELEREIYNDPRRTPEEKAHAAENIALRLARLQKDQ